VQGVKDTALIRVGLIFAAVGVLVEFIGVAALDHRTKGGWQSGIAWIVVGLGVLFIAGYMFWGYWWVKAHPSEFKKRAEAAYGPDSWQEDGKMDQS
jgi:uncharacterized membrane protein